MPNNEIEKTKNHVIKLEKQKKISKKNKKLIIDFVDKLLAEGHRKGNFSANRIKKYIYALVTMSKILEKDFDKATQTDINRLAAKIRERYNGETPRDYLVILRIFMRYVKELDGQKYGKNEFPDIVKKIDPGARQFPKIKRSSLLTFEDVKNWLITLKTLEIVVLCFFSMKVLVVLASLSVMKTIQVLKLVM